MAELATAHYGNISKLEAPMVDGATRGAILIAANKKSQPSFQGAAFRYI